MTTKKTDDDNFFDDDLFDDDIFGDDEDESVTIQGGSKNESSRRNVEDDEDLFDSLLSDQIDLPPRKTAVNSRKAAIAEFEEDHTEVIMDDYETLPNTYLTDDNGKVYNIRRSPFLIGRSKECDLVLNMKGVSRKHAELTFGGGHFVIRDLDSLNGTKVNGVPVPQIRLNDADVIQLGRQKFNFFTQTEAPRAAARPTSAAARPLPSVRNSIALDQQLKQQAQQNANKSKTDLLIKANVGILIVVMVVALGYVIWDDLNPASSGDEMFADAGRQLDAQLNVPPLGDGDVLKVDDDDWTKTGALPPTDEAIDRLAKAVEDQMQGKDSTVTPLRSSKNKSPDVEAEVKSIREDKSKEAERRAAEERRARELALEERSATESAEARNLLDSIIVAYSSGSQLSSSISRMDALADSSVLNNRLKRDLRNTADFYADLRTQYQDGLDLFEQGDHASAFDTWQKLLANEKKVIGNEQSYYARQISDRAIQMTQTKAKAAEDSGNLAEAMNLYNRLAELKPEGPYKAKIDQLMALAEDRFAQAEGVMARDPAKAVELLQSVMEATPRNHPLHVRAEAKLMWLREGLRQ